jgi:hypothetical protein
MVIVPITPDLFVELYPRLYHMAEEGTWESIRDRGLLSTSALLDLFEINGDERFVIESQHRPESIVIEHRIYGRAVIRDQKPMRETSLRNCLIGMTPREWYELLNRKVFFWPTRERLIGLLAAKAYRDRTHCVLTIDTQRIFEAQLNGVRLSPINSGSTIYNPQPRGRHTFFLPEDYPYEERRKMRGVLNAVAELCVDYGVPDITTVVSRVCHMEGPREIDVIYERGPVLD